MNNLETFFTWFGGQAALLLALSYLIKSFLTNRLTKDVEQFKADLKNEADVSIERLKSALQIATIEHQVRFSRLHEKRAEVLADMYQKLVEVFEMGRTYVMNIGGQQDQRDRNHIAVEEKASEFYLFIEKNRIYLPEQVCRLLLDFINSLRKSVINVWVNNAADGDQTERKRVLIEAFNSFSEGPVQKARSAIENAFREILDGDKVLQQKTGTNE